MDAYLTALTLLSRRELSTRQLRDRLARRKFSPDQIDAALERLTRDRTVDDRRVAVAAARIEATVKGRGRHRVAQSLQRLGVSAEVARTAIDDVFSEIDEADLLERALDRRLKGVSPRDLDARARARVVRHLVSRGFDTSQVLTRLRRRSIEVDE
jgi:regulatory protein